MSLTHCIAVFAWTVSKATVMHVFVTASDLLNAWSYFFLRLWFVIMEIEALRFDCIFGSLSVSDCTVHWALLPDSLTLLCTLRVSNRCLRSTLCLTSSWLVHLRCSTLHCATRWSLEEPLWEDCTDFHSSTSDDCWIADWRSLLSAYGTAQWQVQHVVTEIDEIPSHCDSRGRCHWPSGTVPWSEAASLQLHSHWVWALQHCDCPFSHHGLMLKGLPLANDHSKPTVMFAVRQSIRTAITISGRISPELFTNAQVNCWYTARSALLRLLQMHWASSDWWATGWTTAFGMHQSLTDQDHWTDCPQCWCCGDLCHWSWAPSTADFQPSLVGSLPVHWFTGWGLCLHWSWTVIRCGISTELRTLNQLSEVWHELNGTVPFGLRCRRLLGHLVLPVSVLKKFGTPLRHSHCISIYGTDDDTIENTQAAVSTGTAKKYKITVDGITDSITASLWKWKFLRTESCTERCTVF